jgi:hypothetical protein
LVDVLAVAVAVCVAQQYVCVHHTRGVKTKLSAFCDF